ncbi:hydroxymethylglutaryl-coenzyme A synthase N terminal-domain-containing protein [Pelagophyceae sp. CCMP2097]|nr:hydroxymethylglutaryl-coenzyme A synthase N terminal-domain-containing protein [Pelagophyceae sp. CCMP2097]
MRPANVGILAVEAYVPRAFVPQTALEVQDECEGKYVVGLGQDAMAFVDDREDICSVLLTACAALLERYGVQPSEVGRLEVGTETLIDKSKSAKTTLLRLFPNVRDIEGATSTNACYGGTAALLNSCAWVESSAWDGRFAIVVCGDIAVYSPGSARPAGGCAAVAMLVGPDAPLALQPTRATCALDVWDFYKPFHSEYAAVDGTLSQQCYLRSVDDCWRAWKAKRESRGESSEFDYCCFHAPYNKLVQKGFARLRLGDAVSSKGGDFHAYAETWCVAGDATYEASLSDKGLDARLRELSADAYRAKAACAAKLPKAVGNAYTASVFLGLASLVDGKAAELERGARVLLFSYGSGSLATMYSLVGREPEGGRFSLRRMANVLDVVNKLQGRRECTAAHFACRRRRKRPATALDSGRSRL